MPDRIGRRGAAVAVALIAFTAGAGITAGLRRPAAQARVRTTQPRLQDVRPVAELSQAFIAMAEAVTPAVVQIQAERPAPLDADAAPTARDMLDAPRDEVAPGGEATPEIAGGTGFIVADDGYIVTNHHVVADASRITVTLYDKRVYDAELVGSDPTTDVAVIRIPAKHLSAARLGDSDRVRVGEWVLAVGNPGFGPESTLDFTVTSGIVSAKGRPLDILNVELQEERDPAASYAIEDFIQTDAVINPGNSGGPLVDLHGEVIGINTAIASGTGYYQGYGFAIPSNLVRRVMTDLIEYGEVRRPALGVSIRNVRPEDAEVYRLPSISGALVEDFTGAGAPAQEAGLRRGDVIVAVDSVAVERVGQVQRLVAQHRPGQTVRVAVVREGSRRAFDVRLTTAPIPIRHAAPVAVAAPAAPALGIQVGGLSASLAERLGFARPGGAVVLRVQPGSAAERLIYPGDRLLSVDGREVASVGDARAGLEHLRSGQVVSLLLEDASGATHIANIRVP